MFRGFLRFTIYVNKNMTTWIACNPQNYHRISCAVLIKLTTLLCKTPQVESTGEGERKGEKVENREILSCLERKCPVENLMTTYM
jgi:hypothetical protein